MHRLGFLSLSIFLAVMFCGVGCNDSAPEANNESTSEDAGDVADTGDGSDTAPAPQDSGDAADAASRGELEAPQQVSVPAATVGETVEATIELHNVGQGALTITNIVLLEQHGGEFDGQQEFFVGEGFVTSELVLEPSQTHALSLSYTPTNTVRDQATVRVESDDPAQPSYEITVDGPSIGPEIAVDPTAVDFERVPAGGADAEEILTVHNTGSADLEVDDIYVSGSDRFSLSYPDPDNPGRENDADVWTPTVAPGESFNVRIVFQPQDNLAESGELVIASNDPDEQQTIVELRANRDVACLRLFPADEFDFEDVPVNQTELKTLYVENCSDSTPLEIAEISLSDDAQGAFGIDASSLPGGLPDTPAEIAAGERANVVVSFTPAASQAYNGEILIRSNDTSANEVRLPVVGQGIE